MYSDMWDTIEAALQFVQSQRLVDRYNDMQHFSDERIKAALAEVRRLREAGPQLTIDEIYKALEFHECVAGCVDDGISPTLRAIWAAQKALKPLLCRRTQAGRQDASVPNLPDE